MLRVDAGQVFLADVGSGQKWQGDGASRPVVDEHPKDDEDVAIEVGRAGLTGSGVVVTPAPCTCGPYRPDGVSSTARTSLSAPTTSGATTSVRTRQAMRSARLPPAATAV